MSRTNLIVLTVIIIIFGFALYIITPVNAERLGREGMRLGLDLVGGVHLVYETRFPEGTSDEDKARDMERALLVISRRVDKYGVIEPVVQAQGTERIIVKLPGFSDITAAKAMVSQTGYLEFRYVERNDKGKAVTLEDYLKSTENKFFYQAEKNRRIFVDGQDEFLVFLIMDDGELKYTDEAGNAVDPGSLPPETASSLSWIPARSSDGTQLTGELLADAFPTVDQEVTGTKYEVGLEWAGRLDAG